MPIEVRELVIKAAIQSQGSSPSERGAGGTAGTNNSVTPREEIIQACLERILDILKEKHER